MSLELQIIPVAEKDNKELRDVLKQVLIEVGANIPGTAFYDDSLNNMAEFYSGDREEYFVAFDGNKIIGGSGIGRVADKEDYCELQKMYILKEYRGKQIGYRLIQKCLEFAKNAGYHFCYLETFPWMVKAQSLYKSMGFEYIQNRMGNTCHHACNTFMVKSLR